MANSGAHLVSYSETALRDLQDIADYLAPIIGEQSAVTHLERLKASCQALSEMPLRFPVAALSRPQVRRCPCEAWHIFYFVADTITILRIMHQSRDVTAEPFN